ncbi:MAG: hypothetical protein AB7D57_04615 [Desulfovibrionaceae bacterium]
MTSRTYVFSCLALAALMVLGGMGGNVALDEFGLHREHPAGSLRVWTYNRATKYLFSLRYIPSNYEAVLIGSSSSAVLPDPGRLGGLRTYNLSMNGANLCEVAPAARSALERGRMRALVVCLDPYLTKNAVMKTSELSPHLVRSTYGSLFTLRFYGYKLYDLLFPERDPYRESWNGSRLPEPGAPDLDAARLEALVAEQREAGPPRFDPNPAALDCLRGVLDTAHARGVPVLAYHHPIPRPLYALHRAAYEAYAREVDALFAPGDRVLDMNAPDSGFPADDPGCFHDNVHLSRRGGEVLLGLLDRALLGVAAP